MQLRNGSSPACLSRYAVLNVEIREEANVHMHWITRGVGKPLLLIHRLDSTWRAWQLILDDLAAERSITAIDLPGHSATPADPNSGTFEGLVGSVERYLVSHGLIGIDVEGNSIGFGSCWSWHEGEVGNVVALDPSGFWRGWERLFFRTTIGLSARLLCVLRSQLPAISRSSAAQRAILAQTVRRALHSLTQTGMH